MTWLRGRALWPYVNGAIGATIMVGCGFNLDDWQAWLILLGVAADGIISWEAGMREAQRRQRRRSRERTTCDRDL